LQVSALPQAGMHSRRDHSTFRFWACEPCLSNLWGKSANTLSPIARVRTGSGVAGCERFSRLKRAALGAAQPASSPSEAFRPEFNHAGELWGPCPML
jgi:hypothetical protein